MKRVFLIIGLGLLFLTPIYAQEVKENQYNKATINENKKFATYEEAVRFYKKNFVSEIMNHKSRTIAKVSYYKSTARKILLITFVSNLKKQYIYEAVSQEIWQEFKKSTSKGRYYNSKIKGKYSFRLNAKLPN